MKLKLDSTLIFPSDYVKARERVGQRLILSHRVVETSRRSALHFTSSPGFTTVRSKAELLVLLPIDFLVF